MPLKDKLSKFGLKSSKSVNKDAQTQPVSETAQEFAALPSSTSMPHKTTWKGISAKLMPDFLSRKHPISPEELASSHETNNKPDVAASTTPAPTNDTSVLTGVMDRLSDGRVPDAPSSHTSGTTLGKASPATLSTYTRPTASKPPKILAQYANHDGKGAVGSVQPRASHTPYPSRQYVGGQKVVAQYAHYDNKGAVKHAVY
ncbi:hypothetical protein FE257_009591 [Aspergillus nanangensis]|uniref:Uncharacterized protein n=1 Tax=Aspergillus nanangensis TaxID=2582783 RepID=A0AAD4GSN8_ASPNN|nr:hypothetical protein FE257_009591 [Aspergillus nanangensis]